MTIYLNINSIGVLYHWQYTYRSDIMSTFVCDRHTYSSTCNCQCGQVACLTPPTWTWKGHLQDLIWEKYFSQTWNITSDQWFPWQLTNPNYPSGGLLREISYKRDNFCNICKLREILSPGMPFREKETNPTH